MYNLKILVLPLYFLFISCKNNEVRNNEVKINLIESEKLNHNILRDLIKYSHNLNENDNAVLLDTLYFSKSNFLEIPKIYNDSTNSLVKFYFQYQDNSYKMIYDKVFGIGKIFEDRIMNDKVYCYSNDGFLLWRENRLFFIKYEQRIPTKRPDQKEIPKIDYNIGAILFLDANLQVESFIVNSAGSRMWFRKIFYNENGIYNHEIAYQGRNNFIMTNSTSVQDVINDKKKFDDVNFITNQMKIRDEFMFDKKEKFIWLYPHPGDYDYIIIK